MYEPKTYGQYIDPAENRVWTIMDEDYLDQAYTRGTLKNAALVLYSARRNSTTGVAMSASAESDVLLNSRHLESSLKWLAAMPGMCAIVAFLILVWAGNKRDLAARQI